MSTDDSDGVTAQDFQDNLESRFFSKSVAPMEDDKENVIHPEDVADEAVVIDEEPVKRTIPSRKRNLLTSAQEQGKNFKKKISNQAGIIRTTIHNKMKKKPKEKPVAVEVQPIEARPEPEEGVEATEAETEAEAVEETVPPPIQEAPRAVEPLPKRSLKMPKLHRPEFTKNITKPKMPQFKKPNMPKITLPDRPKMPDMSKIKMPRLGRSKSMKEETTTGTTITDSSVTTPEESVSAAPTKKKFDFHFKTYPRLIKDKFKRPKLDRGDRSVRADTPPILEFTTVSKTAAQRGPVASRWIEEESEENGKYNQFDPELERESLAEQRLREEFEKEVVEDDFEARRLLSEEQRQMDEFDRENQEIHEMARQDKPRRVVPARQESEASEDNQMMWSGSLNKDAKEDSNLLAAEDSYKFTLEDLEAQDINRSSTPHTNQETQSSGSSGAMRRKGVIEEIDDDEFILRKKGISNDNIQIGEYISEAIKEGLSQPENGLAGIGHFDAYYPEEQPEKPQRSLRRKNKKNLDEPEDEDHFSTFPPNRPTRKQKKYGDDEKEEEPQIEDEERNIQQVPDMNEFIQEINNNNQMYDEEIMRAMHQDLLPDDEMDEMEFMSKLPVPPTPPRRRKKKIVLTEKYRPAAQQPEIELTAPKIDETLQPEV